MNPEIFPYPYECRSPNHNLRLELDLPMLESFVGIQYPWLDFLQIRCSLSVSSDWNSDVNQVAAKFLSLFSLQRGHFSLYVFECLSKCQLVWNSLPHLWYAVCFGLLPLQPSLAWRFRESLRSNSLEQVGHWYNLAVPHFAFFMPTKTWFVSECLTSRITN